MKVARIWHGTRAEGPFLRTALWLQGCSISCPGCVNPHLWSFEGGSEVDVEELAAQIIESHNSSSHFECQSLSYKKEKTTYSVAFLNTNHESDSINLLSSSSSDIKRKVIEIDLTIDDDEQYLR